MSYTNASNLGVQHTEWVKTLDFYKSELSILENRLTEVAGKNSGADAMAGVEHFQNQFIIQRNNIDELKHAVNEHSHLTAEDAKHHAGKVETGLVSDHKKIEADVKQFEIVINELRHEFNAFLSKWM